MLYKNAFMKTVTASDVDARASNQHELHGVKELETLFGVIPKGQDKVQGGDDPIEATIRVGYSGEKHPINITWYNARANTPPRHEYRLYYDANSAPLVRQLTQGDDILIGETNSGEIEIIIFPSQNTGYSSWTPVSIP